MVMNNELLLVTPIKALIRVFQLMFEKNFWMAVLNSCIRILSGFFVGIALGIGIAVLSYKQSVIEEFVNPLMSMFTTIPVAVFTVLILIWWGSDALAVVICFIVVLPIIYKNTLEGFKSTDYKLIEMARVYRINWVNKALFIYRPSLKPFITSGVSLSLGMSWKSGIAAEVIGTPINSIGSGIYMSKIYFDTAGVFAWAIVIAAISVLFGKIVNILINILFDAKILPIIIKDGTDNECSSIKLTNLVKKYGEETVIDCFSMEYEAGKIYYLNSPSGSGKTTLLRCISGLDTVDEGKITYKGNVSYMFQDDRLCDDYDAITNVNMIPGVNGKADEYLSRLLEPEDLHKPCKCLSGGMKRRVSLVRAMEAGSDVVLLDEPFTGMDEQTKARAQCYIKDRQQGRCIIIATHI